MPSVSKPQARFMAAAAHNSKFAKKAHISQKVAKEFNKADAKTGILKDSKKGKREVEILENIMKEEGVHEHWSINGIQNAMIKAYLIGRNAKSGHEPAPMTTKPIYNLHETTIPKYLYHATYSPRLKSIMQLGLGGKKVQKSYSDSKFGLVYLALDPNVAIDYAETADILDTKDEWYDKIILLQIDTDKIDKSKLSIDKNVIDNAGETLEYSGVIPPAAISVKKKVQEIDNHSRWVLDGGMNSTSGQPTTQYGGKEEITDESVPDFMEPSGIGEPVLGKVSRNILDGAIKIIGFCKTASDRRDALTKYAQKHNVDYQKLYDLIIQDTGTDYFVKDDPKYTFSESFKPFNAFLKKIK